MCFAVCTDTLTILFRVPLFWNTRDVDDNDDVTHTHTHTHNTCKTTHTELGDIITKVGNQVIDVEADLFQALEDFQPGDTVNVTVNRAVAVDDELQMREVVLRIVLQASSTVVVVPQQQQQPLQQQQQQQQQFYQFSPPSSSSPEQ
jgi:hypothetical protein